MSESFGHFNIDGQRHEMTPDNTAVYMHVGKLAVYDHLFTRLGENSGAYIWRYNKSFDDLLELAVDNECELHVNIRRVAERDEKAYIDQATADLGDTMPEDW